MPLAVVVVAKDDADHDATQLATKKIKRSQKRNKPELPQLGYCVFTVDKFIVEILQQVATEYSKYAACCMLHANVVVSVAATNRTKNCQSSCATSQLLLPLLRTTRNPKQKNKKPNRAESKSETKVIQMSDEFFEIAYKSNRQTVQNIAI